jgi:diguanylate cyclase (GGDEF)-like protein
MALAVQNARMFADAEQRADRDPLTGVYHHRYLKTRLEEEVKRAARTGATFAVLMLDIDRFKLVNDNFGHPAGDEALRVLTAVLIATCRESDVVGRYGGDEFLTILNDTDEAHALTVADRIRHDLAVAVLEFEGARIPLTASIGVAEYPRDGRTASDLIATADAALYQSKRSADRVLRLRCPSISRATSRRSQSSSLRSWLAIRRREHISSRSICLPSVTRRPPVSQTPNGTCCY